MDVDGQSDLSSMAMMELLKRRVADEASKRQEMESEISQLKSMNQ